MAAHRAQQSGTQHGASPRRAGLHLLSALGLCFPAVALGGCGSGGSFALPATAQVRFVQVAPATPALDVYVNGTGVAYGLSYESFTSYLPVAGDPVALSAHGVGGSTALATQQLPLQAGRQYTVVLAQGPGSLEQHLYPDQDGPFPAGRTGLRIINEVGGIGSLHFVLSDGEGTAVKALHLGSGAASSYLDLAAGKTYVVGATEGGSSVSLPVATMAVKASSGATRTVVFAGIARGETPRVISFLLNDGEAP